MSKILLYVAILLTLLTAGLGYWNHSCYQIILSQKRETIQQQQQELEKLNEELKSFKEKEASQKTIEEQSQKVVTDAEQARTKAESDLAELQKQLAAKDAELEQKNKDLSTEETTIQSLMAAQKSTAPVLAAPSKKKSSKNTVSEKKDPASPPPDATSTTTLCAPPGAIVGKVAAINPSWNFVVLSVGENNGLTKDSEMVVKRGNQIIGKVKVTSVEPLTSIGDIIPNSISSGSSIQVGDQVVSTSIEMIKK